MADKGDGSGSRNSQELPDDKLGVDTALNATGPSDADLTIENQLAAMAGIQWFPPISEEIAQRFRESLQQLISDAARHGLHFPTWKV